MRREKRLDITEMYLAELFPDGWERHNIKSTFAVGACQLIDGYRCSIIRDGIPHDAAIAFAEDDPDRLLGIRRLLVISEQFESDNETLTPLWLMERVDGGA